MLDILHEVEGRLGTLLRSAELHTMYIDYHPPFVSRIWLQHGPYRVYLHKIEPCKASLDALYHPHPWQSAIRIVQGRYEMGVGHSATHDVPPTDCKLVLPAGTSYEMVEQDAWHYVNPIDAPVFSLMVTGRLSSRQMPVEPKRSFRQLRGDEVAEMLDVFDRYYGLGLDRQAVLSRAAGV